MKQTKKLIMLLILFIISLLILSTNALSATEDDYEYKEEEGTITITKYKGTDSEITIPSTINGKAVTKIGESAFDQCSNLTSIEIPNTVTTIESSAFSWCTNVTTIKIANSVTNIGDYAFNGSANLTSIKIPSSVVSIGELAFQNCDKLVEIIVDKDNRNYTSQDGVLYNKNKTSIISCPTTKENIELPSSVTTIEKYAFFDCDKIRTIKIPSSVTIIGKFVFMGCSNLKEIIIDKDNKNYTSENGVLYNKTKTNLISCLSTKENIEIPDSVTTIENSAFYTCYLLKTIKIPNSVKNIEDEAFWGCNQLTKVEIPSSVTTIGNSAFYWCDALTTVDIPNSVTSIGNDAFSGCSEELTIYGYKSDYIKDYAEWNGINYQEKNDISKCTISEISSQTYTGNAITVNIIVKDGNRALKNGMDYIVTYKNNTNVGTATLAIEGKGTYADTITKTFAILPKDLLKVTVAINTENKIYTGQAITTSIAIKDGDRILKDGIDYIVTYKNNIKVGTATVEIVGKGNYSGKIVKNFNIKEAYILGDVTGDKKIDTKDARQVLLAYVGKTRLTDIQRQAADVNKDGKVDTKDARQILLYYVGKIKKF